LDPLPDVSQKVETIVAAGPIPLHKKLEIDILTP
jgi:hypothetical protein